MKKIPVTYLPASLLLVFLAMVIFTFGGCGGDGGGGSAATATASWQVAPTTVVLGADNPLVDVPAVQSAVDQGGTVILRGTFDFGTDAGNHIIVPGRTGAAQDRKGTSTVFIYQKDVTILGETGQRGELLTVVKNGMPAFWIGWDGEISRVQPSGTYGVDFGIETFPVDVAGRVNYRDTGPEPGYAGPQTRYARAFQNVSATIKMIFFDSPKGGIKATAGRDVFVIGNAFRKVQFGGLVHLNNFAGATHIAAAFGGAGLFYAPFLYPTITGNIVAERNNVDDVATDIINTHAGECFGLVALLTNAAAVRIERNEVRNVGRQADDTGPNLLAAAGILVGDNYKASPLVAYNIVYNSTLNGIWDLVAAAPTPGPTIKHNKLVNCMIGIKTESVIGPRDGALIHQNSISQDGLLGSGQSCIFASWLNASLIRANTFEGDYTEPLVALLSSSNNVLLENRDLRSTDLPEPPTYFLDVSSSGNLIRSASGTALDLGANNKIFLQSPGQGQ
jgi:hypothetical protein